MYSYSLSLHLPRFQQSAGATPLWSLWWRPADKFHCMEARNKFWALDVYFNVYEKLSGAASLYYYLAALEAQFLKNPCKDGMSNSSGCSC